LSLISAIIGKRCECSVYDMLLNTVVDENTSNFICICKHNMVYEGVFENQRLIWHLRFVMQSEFTPRTEPVLHSMHRKKGKKMHRVICVIGGYSYPQKRKLHDMWIVNLSPKAGIVNLAHSDFVMHFSRQINLVYLERNSRLKEPNAMKSDMNYIFYLFDKRDGSRTEIKIKLQVSDDGNFYQATSISESIISLASTPAGNVSGVHAFIPRGSELLFFVEYADNDECRHKLQKFQFYAKNAELDVDSEDHKLGRIGH